MAAVALVWVALALTAVTLAGVVVAGVLAMLVSIAALVAYAATRRHWASRCRLWSPMGAALVTLAAAMAATSSALS